MIDQFTYTLLKHLEELKDNNDRVNLDQFAHKFGSVYGDYKAIGHYITQLRRAYGLIDIDGTKVVFIEKTYSSINEFETERVINQKRNEDEYQNILLQNQNLTRQLNSKSGEIERLTIENLTLQSRSIRRQWIFCVVGIIAGFVTANFGFFQKLFAGP